MHKMTDDNNCIRILPTPFIKLTHKLDQLFPMVKIAQAIDKFNGIDIVSPIHTLYTKREITSIIIAPIANKIQI